jgi:hypothetical protein
MTCRREPVGDVYRRRVSATGGYQSRTPCPVHTVSLEQLDSQHRTARSVSRSLIPRGGPNDLQCRAYSTSQTWSWKYPSIRAPASHAVGHHVTLQAAQPPCDVSIVTNRNSTKRIAWSRGSCRRVVFGWGRSLQLRLENDPNSWIFRHQMRSLRKRYAGS